MQVQIQALLAAGGAGGVGGVERGTTGPKVEVATLAIFNGEAGKVGRFVTACRLYLRMKIREATVEEQVFWVLSHMQGGSADVWKENVLEELESGKMEYETAEELLMTLKKEFGGGEEESVKAAKLRKLEQGGRTMEEFVQEFKQAARGSGYEGRPLVEEFKRGMNGGIRRKLMEAENPPTSIENWYRRATALDRNWRESERGGKIKKEGNGRRRTKAGETEPATTIGVAVSGAVHTGVEVRRMDSEMSGLVERPWLQLMCCAICLPRGRNFR